MSPSVDRRHRVVLGEHVAGLVDVAGDRDHLGPRRIGGAAHDDLLGEPIDEVRAVDVPAEIEPDERDAPPRLDRHDLAEEDAGVLAQVVAWLARDRHAERTEMAREGGRVGVEVDRRAPPRGPARRARPRR